ncbi:hypothetical protein [Pedobacter africanus]|uniref:Uncharacterized protein n=1 Tax=Pedobacter africanus TaxID=151894 RepID=A0ACC6KZD6_9SPHI|nr:hypothetical protein [Pedobacter africanus]MDR6784596.1 hypothetical protein [Pedobacter africanus]
MDNLNENAFDFLKEISKGSTYNLLFPDPRAGIAVVWLYQRVENGSFSDKTFTENDVHQALYFAAKINGSNAERNTWEFNNRLIADLQEYFLYYDEARQVYKLKEYANEFCRRASNILKASFDPTVIEKICLALREKLEECIAREKLEDWFGIHFRTFQPQLRQQIDFLDRQIDHSVAEMRQNLSIRDKNITLMLKQIDDRFDLIRKQNNELRAGFSEMDQIRRKLESFSIENEDNKLGNLIYEAITFFQEMKQTLSLVDSRLDRVQPKVKQLFSNLNKPLFNTRVERFIGYLIGQSKVIASKRSMKSFIEFPSGVTTLKIYQDRMDLCIFERKKDLFPIKATKRFVAEEDEKARAVVFDTFSKKLQQQDLISNWIDRIMNDLVPSGKLKFSNYFFLCIGKDDNLDIGLGINLAYRCLKVFGQHHSYRLLITDELVVGKETNISLWEMIIEKK